MGSRKRDAANGGAGGELPSQSSALARTREVPMKTASVLGAALALLAVPALAQYGDGAQNAGGPLGSYARRAGINYGYGGPYGGYAYGPYYGGHWPPAHFLGRPGFLCSPPPR